MEVVHRAARLAAGVIDFAGVGPAYPVEEIVLHNKLFHPLIEAGHAEGIITNAGSTFGNLDTNIPVDSFADCGFAFGDTVHVAITHEGKTFFEADVLYHKSFGFVAAGQPILFNGSSLYLGMALNQANFVKTYGVKDGESWKVSITK